jgi:hypothetical protein
VQFLLLVLGLGLVASAVPGISFYGSLDVIAAYFSGEDDNWSLGASPDKNKFTGLVLQGGYVWLLEFFCAAQYDKVDGDDNSMDFEMTTLSGWYLPRENMRLGLIGRFDHSSADRDELSLAHRAMF